MTNEELRNHLLTEHRCSSWAIGCYITSRGSEVEGLLAMHSEDHTPYTDHDHER